MDRLHQSFRRAESQLVSVLERRKGEVKVVTQIVLIIYLNLISMADLGLKDP